MAYTIAKRIVGLDYRGISFSPVTYATWDNTFFPGAGVTYSNGDLTATIVSGYWTRSTVGVSSGKWYWEVTIPDVFSSAGATSNNPTQYTWNTNKGVAWRGGFSLTTWLDGVGIDTTLASFAATTMGCALDMDNLQFYFYRNGVLASEAAINPVTGLQAGVYYASVSRSGPSVPVGTFTANFGATPFAYTPPVGFNAGLYV